MAVIRWILGRIILLLNFIFSPRSPKRPAEEQAKLDQATANLALYQFEACPFCVKVRRAMKRHGLNIETRDAKKDARARDELMQGGGRVKVPCLRIEEEGEVKWMYESGDIVRYLENRFVGAS
ncbi:glutaredoxin family protein [Marinobacterium arenosum]|uniref:glutaredoxin family protein n=1 Tax=Marinobacterium arenosum TaxID=2862496 RepID=UPI001C9621C2|nr:glutaredoxin [Marinobacterium arenosum]MBY4675103.1 glutaredoxin [Marinobacterium arenosum]